MKSRIKVVILQLLISMYVVLNAFGQEVPPLVFDVENTGVDCTKPPLPTITELPVVEPLTDPFEWSDGSGRDTTYASWVKRRNEIKVEIENYEIGPKPERPDTINATFSNDTLKVHITVNGETLTLTSVIILPEGAGPFPAIIGIGFGAGSLPVDIFTSRDIAVIPFPYWEVMAHTQSRGNEPINRLYPELTYMGAYSAWPWGVSRLIDGLELVSGDLPVDLEHLAISGCSFAGKMALFAGALDERIALTISQEPGGGGAAAWRVSETLTSVETLGATSSAWFMESMFDFQGENVSKLPHDHHELVAMVAPRALLVLGNPPIQWLADESGYVSCMAAKKVWEAFEIPDRFGFCFVGGHDHCAMTTLQRQEVEAFVDKFLLGDTLVNTNFADHPFDHVIPTYWTDWWGSEEPYFPVVDRTGSDEVWLEAECADIGAAWNVRLDTLASNGSYMVPKPGLYSSTMPTDPEALVTLSFTVSKDTTYHVYNRLSCPTLDNNSYWMAHDDETLKLYSSKITEGWEWIKFTDLDLTAGEHTLTYGFLEDGVEIDKICISDFYYSPRELGDTAELLCVPDTTTVPYTPIIGLNEINASGGYSLGQNYPNPLNNNTTIAFEIPHGSYVSLKVYSMLGKEVAELAGKEYTAGKHKVEFNAQSLSKGIYFYTLKAGDFSASRKMIIQSE